MGLPAKYGFMVFAFIVCFAIFIHFFNPSFFFPKQCTFSGSLVECIDYSMENATLELTLKNPGGSDLFIYDIVVTSTALANSRNETEAGSCSLKDSDMGLTDLGVRIDGGKRHSFVLNTSTDGSKCAYSESARGKNRYDLSVKYAIVRSPPLPKTFEGRLVV